MAPRGGQDAAEQRCENQVLTLCTAEEIAGLGDGRVWDDAEDVPVRVPVLAAAGSTCNG